MKSLYFILVGAVVIASIACTEPKQELVASIADQSITKAQFDAFLKFKRLSTDDAKRVDKALDGYLEREALALAIEQEEVLDAQLIAAELNEFRKEMLISRYFEKYLDDVVSDKAVANYYNTNAADYEEQKVKVAHVLVRVKKKMGQTERAAKMTKIQEAYSKLRKGTAFEQIVAEYSEDKVSAKKGGDLGWLKKGAVDEKFSETAFSLKKDELSEPFETPFGFHIVKVLEEPKVAKKPLRAVEGDIRYQLRAKAKRAEVERLTKKLKINKVSPKAASKQ